MKLGFGKYKDLDLREVPEDYLIWLIQKGENDIRSYKLELERRENADDADASIMERLVKKGFRAMAKEMHPDHGGTTAGMQELNAAFEAVMGKVKR